jgi:murein DD-endopeptidase MepM/ murein hydrolase activator NlpD
MSTTLGTLELGLSAPINRIQADLQAADRLEQQYRAKWQKPINLKFEFARAMDEEARKAEAAFHRSLDTKIKPEIDDSALTKLNDHLSLKESHLAQVVAAFESNAITPAVDDHQLTALNEQLAALRDRKFNITPVAGKMPSLASLGNSALNTATAPIRAVGRGALEGVGKTFTTPIVEGIQSALDQAMAGTVGSPKLVGEKLGDLIAGGIKGKLGKNLSQEIKDLADDVLGRENIDRVGGNIQGKRRKKIDKETESAASELNLQRRDVTRQQYKDIAELEDNKALVNRVDKTVSVAKKETEKKTLKADLFDLKPLPKDDLIADPWGGGNGAQRLHLSKQSRLRSEADKSREDLGSLETFQADLVQKGQELESKVSVSKAKKDDLSKRIDTLSPQTTRAYQDIAESVAGRKLSKQENPEIVVADALLAKKQSKGIYQPEGNLLYVTSEIDKQAKSGKLTGQSTETIYHENVHANDFQYGSVEGVRASKQHVAQPLVKREFNPDELEFATKNASLYKPYRDKQGNLIDNRPAELSAYGMQYRAKDQFASADRRLDLAEFQKDSNYGYAGARFKQFASATDESQKGQLKDLAGVVPTDEILELIAIKKEIKAKTNSLIARIHQSVGKGELEAGLPAAIDENIAQLETFSKTVELTRRKHSQSKEAKEVTAVTPAIKDPWATDLAHKAGEMTGNVVNSAGKSIDSFATRQINKVLATNIDPNTIDLNPRQISSVKDLKPHDALHAARLGTHQIASAAAPVYGALKGVENAALTVLPFGKQIKSLTQNTVLPAAAFAAASHVPILGNVMGGLGHLMSGGADMLAGSAAHALGSQFGNVPLIGQGIQAALSGTAHMSAEAIAPIATSILGGKAVLSGGQLGQKLLLPNKVENKEPELEYLAAQVTQKALEHGKERATEFMGDKFALPSSSTEPKKLSSSSSNLALKLPADRGGEGAIGLEWAKNAKVNTKKAYDALKQAISENNKELAFQLSSVISENAGNWSKQIAEYKSQTKPGKLRGEFTDVQTYLSNASRLSTNYLKENPKPLDTNDYLDGSFRQIDPNNKSKKLATDDLVDSFSQKGSISDDDEPTPAQKAAARLARKERGEKVAKEKQDRADKLRAESGTYDRATNSWSTPSPEKVNELINEARKERGEAPKLADQKNEFNSGESPEKKQRRKDLAERRDRRLNPLPDQYKAELIPDPFESKSTTIPTSQLASKQERLAALNPQPYQAQIAAETKRLNQLALPAAKPLGKALPTPAQLTDEWGFRRAPGWTEGMEQESLADFSRGTIPPKRPPLGKATRPPKGGALTVYSEWLQTSPIDPEPEQKKLPEGSRKQLPPAKEVDQKSPNKTKFSPQPDEPIYDRKTQQELENENASEKKYSSKASRKFDRAYDRANRDLDDSINNSGKAINDELKRIGDGVPPINKVTEGLKDLAWWGKAAATSFLGFTVISTLAPALLGFAASSLKAADDLERLQIRLEQSTGSISKGKERFAELSQTAKDLKISRSGALATGAGFAGSALGTDFEGLPSEQLTDKMLKFGKGRGQTKSEQDGTRIALLQIMGKPRVAAQELNQLTESGGITDARGIGARALGMSPQQFTKAQQSVQGIDSQRFVSKFLAQGVAESNLTKDQSLNTIDSKQQGLSNSVEQFSSTIGGGLSPAYKAGLDLLTASIDLLNQGIQFGSKVLIGYALYSIPAVVGGLGKLGQMALAATGAINGTSVALNLLKMGGWTAAFFAAGAAIEYFSYKLKSSTEDIDKQIESVGKLVHEYNKLNGLKPSTPKIVGSERELGSPEKASWPEKALNWAEVNLLAPLAEGAVALDGGSRKGENPYVYETKNEQDLRDKKSALLATDKESAKLEPVLKDSEKASKEVNIIDAKIESLKTKRAGLIELDPNNVEPVKKVTAEIQELNTDRAKLDSKLSLPKAGLEALVKTYQAQKDNILSEIGAREKDSNGNTKATQSELDLLKEIESKLVATKARQSEFNEATRLTLDSTKKWELSIDVIKAKYDGLASKIALVKSAAEARISLDFQNDKLTPGQLTAKQQQSEQSGRVTKSAELELIIKDLTLSLEDFGKGKERELRAAYKITDKSTPQDINAAATSTSNPQDKAALGVLSLKAQASQDLQLNNNEIITSQNAVKTQLYDQGRSIVDYYNGISKSSNDLLIEIHRSTEALRTQALDAKLKNSLIGATDSFSSYIGEMISAIDGFGKDMEDSKAKAASKNVALQDAERQRLQAYEEKQRSFNGNAPGTQSNDFGSAKPAPALSTSPYDIYSGGRKVSNFKEINQHHGNARGQHVYHEERGQTYRSDGGVNREVRDIVLSQKGSSAVPVPAPIAGTVRTKTTAESGGYGNLVEILNQQGEVISRSAHLANLLVKTGDVVQPGQGVGFQGNTGHSTGTYLHSELPSELFPRYVKSLMTGNWSEGYENQQQAQNQTNFQSPTSKSPTQNQTTAATPSGFKLPSHQVAGLGVIAQGETSKPNSLDSYYEAQGGGQMNRRDFAKGFPKTPKGKGNIGRYQMREADWIDARRLDPTIPDNFLPETQDRVALTKMYRMNRGGKELDNYAASPTPAKFKQFVDQSSKEWESKQPEFMARQGQTYSSLERKYQEVPKVSPLGAKSKSTEIPTVDPLTRNLLNNLAPDLAVNAAPTQDPTEQRQILTEANARSERDYQKAIANNAAVATGESLIAEVTLTGKKKQAETNLRNNKRKEADASKQESRSATERDLNLGADTPEKAAKIAKFKDTNAAEDQNVELARKLEDNRIGQQSQRELQRELTPERLRGIKNPRQREELQKVAKDIPAGLIALKKREKDLVVLVDRATKNQVATQKDTDRKLQEADKDNTTEIRGKQSTATREELEQKLKAFEIALQTDPTNLEAIAGKVDTQAKITKLTAGSKRETDLRQIDRDSRDGKYFELAGRNQKKADKLVTDQKGKVERTYTQTVANAERTSSNTEVEGIFGQNVTMKGLAATEGDLSNTGAKTRLAGAELADRQRPFVAASTIEQKSAIASTEIELRLSRDLLEIQKEKFKYRDTTDPAILTSLERQRTLTLENAEISRRNAKKQSLTDLNENRIAQDKYATTKTGETRQSSISLQQAQTEGRKFRGEDTRSEDYNIARLSIQTRYESDRDALKAQRDAITGTDKDSIAARDHIDQLANSLNQLNQINLDNLAQSFDGINQILTEAQKNTTSVLSEFAKTGKFDWKSILRKPLEVAVDKYSERITGELFKGLYNKPEQPKEPPSLEAGKGYKLPNLEKSIFPDTDWASSREQPTQPPSMPEIAINASGYKMPSGGIGAIMKNAIPVTPERQQYLRDNFPTASGLNSNAAPIPVSIVGGLTKEDLAIPPIGSQITPPPAPIGKSIDIGLNDPIISKPKFVNPNADLVLDGDRIIPKPKSSPIENDRLVPQPGTRQDQFLRPMVFEPQSALPPPSPELAQSITDNALESLADISIDLPDPKSSGAMPQSSSLLGTAGISALSGLFPSLKESKGGSSILSLVGGLFGGLFAKGGVIGRKPSDRSALKKHAKGGIIGAGRSLADDQLLHLPIGSGILTHAGVDNIGGAAAIRALNQDTFTKFKPEDSPKAGYQSILAQNGEGVLTPRGVANLGGEGMLNVINRPKISQFATGGVLASGSGSVALPKLHSASSVTSNNKLDIIVSGDFDKPGVDTMAGREMINAIQAVVNQMEIDKRRSRV